MPRVFIDHLKRAAKEESKASSRGYTYHLEQIGKYGGFPPWRALKAAIMASSVKNRSLYVDSDLCERILSGLEKALPITVSRFAAREAERIIEASGMCFPYPNTLGHDPTATALRDFLVTELPNGWSQQLKESPHDKLASRGTTLVLEELMLDFQMPFN